MHSKAFFTTLFSAYSIISGQQASVYTKYSDLKSSHTQSTPECAMTGTSSNQSQLQRHLETWSRWRYSTVLTQWQPPSDNSSRHPVRRTDVISWIWLVVVRETRPGTPHLILYAVFHVSDIKLSVNFIWLKFTLRWSHNFCHVGVFNACFPKYGIGTLEDCPDLANSLMARGEFLCM